MNCKFAFDLGRRLALTKQARGGPAHAAIAEEANAFGPVPRTPLSQMEEEEAAAFGPAPGGMVEPTQPRWPSNAEMLANIRGGRDPNRPRQHTFPGLGAPMKYDRSRIPTVNWTRRAAPEAVAGEAAAPIGPTAPTPAQEDAWMRAQTPTRVPAFPAGILGPKEPPAPAPATAATAAPTPTPTPAPPSAPAGPMPPEDFGAKVERDVAELRKKFGMPPLPPKEIREYMPGGSRAGGAAGAAGATGATGARGATGTTGRTAAPRGRKMSQREQKIDERLRNLAQAELTNEQWGNVLTSLAYRGRPDLARKLMMYASEAQAPEEAGDLFSLLGGGGGGGRGGLMQAAMWNPMFQQFSPFNFGQMAGGMGGGGGQNFWNLPYGEQVRAFNRPYQMANFTGFGDWAGFNEANKLLAARRAGNAAKDRQFRELLATWR